MKVFYKPLFIGAIRWLFAGIFIYAGAIKMGSPQNFADSIASFAILPNHLINLVALGLPPFEILAGVAMLAGIQRRAALLGLTSLTIVFLIALVSAILRGIPIDCGCFGSEKPSMEGAWISFARDIPIFGMGVFLYVRSLSRDQISKSKPMMPTPALK